jgi:hypothetical protein
VLQVAAAREFDIRDSYIQPLVVVQRPLRDDSPFHEYALFRSAARDTGHPGTARECRWIHIGVAS